MMDDEQLMNRAATFLFHNNQRVFRSIYMLY